MDNVTVTVTATAEFRAAHAAMVAAEVELNEGRMSVEAYGPIWQRANDAQRALADMGAWPLAAAL